MRPTSTIADPTWQDILDRDAKIEEQGRELAILRLLPIKIAELENEARSKTVRSETGTSLPSFAVEALADAGLLAGQSASGVCDVMAGRGAAVMPVGPMVGPGHVTYPDGPRVRPMIPGIGPTSDKALEKRVSDLEKAVAELKANQT